MRTQMYELEDVIPVLDFLEEAGSLDGYIIVMKPSKLAAKYKKPQFQLWRCRGGFGAKSGTIGRAVYADCLADNESAHWTIGDWLGVIKPVLMPEVTELIGKDVSWKE